MTDNFETEPDTATEALWSLYPHVHAAMSSCDGKVAAQALITDPRCQAAVADRLRAMLAELRLWTPGDAGHRSINGRLRSLVGGFVTYGHDAEEFAAYLRRNNITLAGVA